MEGVIKRAETDNGGYRQDAANNPQDNLPGTLHDKKGYQQESYCHYAPNYPIRYSHVHSDTSILCCGLNYPAKQISCQWHIWGGNDKYNKNIITNTVYYYITPYYPRDIILAKAYTGGPEMTTEKNNMK
jgi:hypothetical protein